MEPNKIGVPREGTRTKKLNESMEEWAETPFFIAGIPEGAEHAIPLEEGRRLSGKIVMLKESQDGKTHYVCLEDAGGNKFRVRAGKVVREALAPLAKGTEVILTYNGQKQSAKSGNTYKDFTVEVVEGNLN